MTAYGDSSRAVVLDNFVLGLLRTTTDDGRITRAQNRDGILAHITEPHICQCAGTKAVYTLERVGTNDDIGETSTVLENKHGIIAAGVLVRVARLTTVKLLVAKIHAAGNGRWRWERDNGTDTGRDVEGLRRA